MRSLGKGVMSATTQVKVLSPEIIFVALGQGFHCLEASIGMYGKCLLDRIIESRHRLSCRTDAATRRFTSRYYFCRLFDYCQVLFHYDANGEGGILRGNKPLVLCFQLLMR